MLDSKMLLVILAIALVVFGTKRLRSVGTDLGAAVKGFKQAMNEGESEERVKQLNKDADFEPGVAAPGAGSAAQGVNAAGTAAPGVANPSRDAEVRVPPKPNA